MVEDAISVNEMARQLHRAANTVRYWLGQYGMTPPKVGAGRVREHGTPDSTADVIQSVCSTHGRTAFARRANGYYRCRKCSSEAVSRWRRNAKARLVEAAGGECAICGYDESPAALEFHHVEPEMKSFGLAAGGLTRSFAQLQAEADKCVLLCSNCHATIEAGHRELPPNLTPVKLSDGPAQK
jgi:hypothetical protein